MKHASPLELALTEATGDQLRSLEGLRSNYADQGNLWRSYA
jgi:hypothetical protein